MEFDKNLLMEVVESVWLSTIGLSIEPTEDLTPPEGADARYLYGRVEIQGAWNGVATITCPTTLARQAMSIMCDVDQDTLTDDEVKDALGEVTNMIGGNVKSLVPGPSHLTLPQVGAGFDDGLSTAGGAKPVSQVGFTCLGELLMVTLAAV